MFVAGDGTQQRCPAGEQQRRGDDASVEDHADPVSGVTRPARVEDECGAGERDGRQEPDVSQRRERNRGVHHERIPRPHRLAQSPKERRHGQQGPGGACCGRPSSRHDADRHGQPGRYQLAEVVYRHRGALSPDPENDPRQVGDSHERRSRCRNAQAVPGSRCVQQLAHVLSIGTIEARPRRSKVPFSSAQPPACPTSRRPRRFPDGSGM